ncbi:hypothetical protein C8F01DRAFT_1251756 [Mycena amicta]|nr:hypothetical protein C8F01DRAFT_1251756 [Mycena amicta]
MLPFSHHLFAEDRAEYGLTDARVHTATQDVSRRLGRPLTYAEAEAVKQTTWAQRARELEARAPRGIDTTSPSPSPSPPLRYRASPAPRPRVLRAHIRVEVEVDRSGGVSQL